MIFYKYLQDMLVEHKISRKKFRQEMKTTYNVDIAKATVALWLLNERRPNHDTLTLIVGYFAKTDLLKKKHLYFIYFGADNG